MSGTIHAPTRPGSPGPRSGPDVRTGLRRLLRQRALPAYVGALVVWIATSLLAGKGTFSTLSAGIVIGTFLLVVGIGQLFVITSGNGGIDLSVPYVMTLSAYLSCAIMDGKDGTVFLGLLAALLLGLATAGANIILIQILSMPPIVATLAIGFVLQSVVLVYSGKALGNPSPGLVSFVTGRVGPIPILVIFGIVITIIFTLVLTKTTYGRHVLAIGQSVTAARLAGVRPNRVRNLAYVICAVAAAISGYLLGGYSGGPSLTMGTTYQLGSIAVVVLGGTLIVGGLSNVPGVWAAALLLTLLITLVNVAGLGQGTQDIVQGVLIILVLVVGGTRRRKE